MRLNPAFIVFILLFSVSCSNYRPILHKSGASKSTPEKIKKTKEEKVSIFGYKTEVEENYMAERKLEEPLNKFCYNFLKDLPGEYKGPELEEACSEVKVAPGCYSVQGRPIFHMDREGKGKGGIRVLTIGLIHGDEFPAGSVGRAWMERLTNITPRSTWRIIPISNPDGVILKTRPNANKVDINRNFPTVGWEKNAYKMWVNRYKKSWRKFPGESAASEPETQCLMSHIQNFKPDFIISVHTPLGHLDFDGPKMQYPDFNLLPWRRFGHFPGSLGRYMWRDHQIPVLTIELKGNTVIKSFDELDKLQDISGNLAIKAKKEIKEAEVTKDN